VTLIKTSLLNAIAVIIKMLTLLGVNKILAVYVGPAGYAALGQFQNAIQMITSFAGGAINTGVIKYTAEYYDDEKKQRMVWRTAGTISFIGSTIAALLIFIFSEELAVWFLKDPKYSGVFIWFAATLVFFTSNTLLLAILNGKKEIARYVVANIAGSIFSLVVTTFMSVQFSLYGALVSLAVYQSLSFFVTFYLCYKLDWFKISYFFGGIDKLTAIKLAKYAAMALTSAACVPLSHMLVRNHLGETISWEAAGYWEAMWRLSTAYLLLVTTTLSVYYLPRLSELKKVSEIKNEVIQGYKIILPIAATSGVIIYILRDFIITTLFTQEFLPMRELFAWQMIGDTLKIASWILAYVMLGEAMVRLFILTEILFSASFLILTYMFTSFYGVEGVVIAHSVNYFIYFILVGISVLYLLNRR
jgi:PST family polysaccharide transporter